MNRNEPYRGWVDRILRNGVPSLSLSPSRAQVHPPILDDFRRQTDEYYDKRIVGEGVEFVDSPIGPGKACRAEAQMGTPDIPTRQGFRYSIWARVDNGSNGSEPFLAYGWQDEENWYMAHYQVASDRLQIGKRVGGDLIDVYSETSVGNFEEGEFYQLALDWRLDGHQTLRLLDIEGGELGSIETQDNEFAEGGFGFGTRSFNGKCTFAFPTQRPL
jgi:hypothetical protein